MTARIRLQPEAIGVGLTSHRVRDRLIERPDRSDAEALRGVPERARLQAVEVLLGPRALGAAPA
jgi:protein-L-isoaspartate(D-aspartate) O-methyltransferase